MSQQNADDAPVPLDPDDEEPVLLEPPAPAADVDEPISLAETSGPSQVRMSKRFQDRAAAKADYKRQLNVTGAGATRCRVFHTKVSAAAIEMMQKQINDWLDSEEIEIKHVAQTMGIMKGKTDEENVIITVWY